MTIFDSARELAWIRERLGQLAPVAGEAAVIATSLQGLVAAWNEGAEDLYGWSEREALGQDILDLTPAAQTLERSGEIMQTLQAGAAWQGGILLRHRHGAAIPAFVINVPVGDFSGRQGAIVGVSVPSARGALIASQATVLSAEIRRRFPSAP